MVCAKAVTEKNIIKARVVSNLAGTGGEASLIFFLIMASCLVVIDGSPIEIVGYTCYKVSNLETQKLPIKASDEFYTNSE
jgi:hypothetical protein